MTIIHALGVPRIGAQRELKFALEKHWSGQTREAELEATAQALRLAHWQRQKDAGLDFLTVGDFSLYDHVADHIQLFGCEPARFRFTGEQSALQRYFTMARGLEDSPLKALCACCHPVAPMPAPVSASCALEMTKWFDTNYHYLVPEFDSKTTFALHSERLLGQVQEAKALGVPLKPVVLGPLTFLWLGKSKEVGFDRLRLLDALIPHYAHLLTALANVGIEWVQVDEPILGLDLPQLWREAFAPTYAALQPCDSQLMLTTYFSPLEDHVRLACQLPVAGLHIDAVRAPQEIASVLEALPADKQLSLGIVDGRNIWRTPLAETLTALQRVQQQRGAPLWLAPSCALMHVPYTLAQDPGVPAPVRSWLAGADEKLQELAVLKQGLQAGAPSIAQALSLQQSTMAQRAHSPQVHRPAVAARVASLPASAAQRAAPWLARQSIQRQRLNLPLWPTTTIGSLPQTPEIRASRGAFKRGTLSQAHYHQCLREAIAQAIRKQEMLGLDVLVHGEAERDDSVAYFAAQLEGFACSANGWVQSYGSRCVRPPILYGDVVRPQSMTVAWSTYAQSLTQAPVKGMLTGPNTLVQWSFVRQDQPRETTTQQVALAMREEVLDLEAAGLAIIQIDEPALREGLPLRKAQWQPYLAAATHAFRLTAAGVQNTTQIHTHLCYSGHADILGALAALDADVISLETSRSDKAWLDALSPSQHLPALGPGVYDVHAPRVPSAAEMVRVLEKAQTAMAACNLWVNPDCGLKTRTWPQAQAALKNMVAAAKKMRKASAA